MSITTTVRSSAELYAALATIGGGQSAMIRLGPGKFPASDPILIDISREQLQPARDRRSRHEADGFCQVGRAWGEHRAACQSQDCRFARRHAVVETRTDVEEADLTRWPGH